MKNKEEFISCLSTLLCSWGSDTPSEAIWAANELLKWLEKEYNVTFEHEFLELDESIDWDKAHPNENLTDLIFDEIRNKL